MKLKMFFMLLAAGLLSLNLQSCDNDDEQGLALLTEDMRSIIGNRYPGADIVEADTEPGGVEVDIIHNGTKKEVHFDAGGKWIRTSWDVLPANVPQAVMDAAKAGYPDYLPDDADYVETPDGDYYLIELERGELDVYVRVKPDGTVLQ